VAARPDRRSDILRRSADLFARHGVASTTVRQIADEVGVLAGSLYHHFSSKDAIVDAIVSAYVDDLRARYRTVLDSGGDPRHRLEQLIAASLQAAKDHPGAALVHQDEMSSGRFAAAQEAAAENQRSWLAVIEEGRADGSFRHDLEPVVFYRFLCDAARSSAHGYHPDGPDTIDELAAACIAVFLDGFAAVSPG
jgi:TetR/AcrR family transcriptional regulator, cholesterol catabolism regulator